MAELPPQLLCSTCCLDLNGLFCAEALGKVENSLTINHCVIKINIYHEIFIIELLWHRKILFINVVHVVEFVELCVYK